MVFGSLHVLEVVVDDLDQCLKILLLFFVFPDVGSQELLDIGDSSGG